MIVHAQDQKSGYEPQLEELKEMALGYAATARERLAEGTGMIRNYMTKEPVRALGIALGLGVLLGWLIKRR